MKYRKLELLLMSVGLVGILISMMSSLINGSERVEILGQALFVPVLFFALHYGRQLGYLAAVGAALVFLIAKTQELGQLDVMTLADRLILMQAASFGLVGIIGGELATRIKYVVARIADEEYVDEQTHVFSSRYMRKLIAKLLSSYERHDRVFSVLFIDMAWQEPILEKKRTNQVNRVARVLRDNVRLIDEVGYLDDGRFCLVLPETDIDGVKVVRERLRKAYSLAGQYSRFSAEWKMTVLTLPENEPEIKHLAARDEQAKVIA